MFVKMNYDAWYIGKYNPTKTAQNSLSDIKNPISVTVFYKFYSLKSWKKLQTGFSMLCSQEIGSS